MRPDGGLLFAALACLLLAAMCELAIPALATRAVFAAARDRAAEAFGRNIAGLAAATVGYAVFAALRGGAFALVSQWCGTVGSAALLAAAAPAI